MKIDTTSFNIKQVTQYDGTTKIVLSPKKRKCKVCAKQFDSIGTEFLLWNTQEKFSVRGWFCRKHYIEAKKLIKIWK